MAQVAAVQALQEPAYYARRYAETHELRESFARQLAALPGWAVIPGVANFLLCHTPENGLDASAIVRLCRARGFFLRDASAMGRRLGGHALRIAVKDAETNEKMLRIISDVTQSTDGNRRAK
jgi:histidinol-phosphate/aromatic aminotransferase/cobyric acid decarboxylase-like protein